MRIEGLTGVVSPQLSVQACGLTDVGLCRQRNEDQFAFAGHTGVHSSIELNGLPQRLRDGVSLYIVADGMGGHQRGDLASCVALTAALDSLFGRLPWLSQGTRDESRPSDVEIRAALFECVGAAHSAVVANVVEDRKLEGMGTTLSGALIIDGKLFIVHIGDSRIYRLRDGQIRQLTRDHTVAQGLVDEGKLEEGELEGSPYANMLSQAVGGTSIVVSPDLLQESLLGGDSLVLCSDGLTRHLSESDLLRIVGQNTDSDVEATCQRLVDTANGAGGRDNVTVIVARFTESSA